MGTQLGALTSAVMSAAADSDGSAYVIQWANWAIQEIWSDRLWPFKVRELPDTNINAGDYKTLLPANFDHPREFRLKGSSPTGRKLFRITDELLRRRVNDPIDITNASTPKFWVDPILSDTYDNAGVAIKSVRYWPPADNVYILSGSYYASHPIIGPTDFILLPPKWDSVLVDRLRVYIKEFEDEIDITPWVKKYEMSLSKMRNDIGKHVDALPSWKPEKFLEQIDSSFIGTGRDIDLGE